MTLTETQTQGFALLKNLATFLIHLSRLLFSTEREWQVEILPLRHDPIYMLAPSHEPRNKAVTSNTHALTLREIVPK